MKRFFAVLALLLGSFSGTPIANAAGSSCISLGFPSVTSSATSINVRVTANSSCKTPFGISNGGAVYTITGETSLSSSCSGPYDYSNFGGGTITCTIYLGGALGSSRAYATSSTIHIWFAYDFSTKDIAFTHPAIPAKSSGGSSGGGGTSGGAAPIIPSCTAAPNTPNLAIEWNSTGPKFTFSPQATGQKAATLYWSYSLWNSTTNAWEGWASWTMAPLSTGSYQASVIEGKTKIAFAVYAANACGDSTQAREVNGNTGVALAPLIEDQIVKNDPFPTLIKVGATLQIYGVAKSQLGLALEASSWAPTICDVDSSATLKIVGAGTCRISVMSKSFQNKVGAKPSLIDFIIPEPRVPQVTPNYPFSSQYEVSLESIVFTWKASSGLPVSVQSQTEDICSFVEDSKLVFNKVGYCEFTATQSGDSMTLPAESRDFQISIVDSRKTLICLKGKITKKVVGIYAKCPAGFKVKK